MSENERCVQCERDRRAYGSGGDPDLHTCGCKEPLREKARTEFDRLIDFAADEFRNGRNGNPKSAELQRIEDNLLFMAYAAAQEEAANDVATEHGAKR